MNKERRYNLDESTIYEVNKQVQSSVAPMTRVLYDLNQTLKGHIASEGSRINTIDDRLDKHLEIYSNNGKESKRVADNLEILITQHKEMYDIFQTLKGGKTTIRWVIGTLMFLGGAYLMVKQIIK